MMIYDAILEGDDATEADALDYARGMVWDEVEASEQEIKYSQFSGPGFALWIQTSYDNNKKLKK